MQWQKKIGAIDQMNKGDTVVDSLSDLTNKEAALKIAEHFAEISNQYNPIDNTQLPCYLPALMQIYACTMVKLCLPHKFLTLL